MTGSLKEISAELDERRHELHEIYAQAGDDFDLSKVSAISGDTAQKAAEITRRNTEINKLGGQKSELLRLVAEGEANSLRAQLENSEATKNMAGGRRSDSASTDVVPFHPRDLHQKLKNDRGLQQFQAGNLRSFTIDLPGTYWNAIITLASMTPQAERMPTRDMALETRTVADLMLQGNTDRPTIDYFEETTVTNAAATVAEEGLKPESALAWTLRTETVRKIATWVPATKESLDDIPLLESMIRGRLAYMVQRAEEAQILNGDGVAPNILGILARGIQTQAKGADPTPDAIYKAMQKVRGASGSGFSEPTAVVVHPNDWTDIKLLRTTDGIYLWGNPSDEGPDRIWGLPVRQTTAMPEGTALVGAFRPEAEVFRREGVSITVATEDGSDFLYNRVKIMAESRLLLAVYRPSAFASVTGI